MNRGLMSAIFPKIRFLRGLQVLAGGLCLFLLACSGVGGGAPGGLSGAAPAPELEVAAAIPGAPAGETSTKFDPGGRAKYQATFTQVRLCRLGEEDSQFLVKGFLTPLPGVQEAVCNGRVLRTADFDRHVFVDALTQKGLDGVDCSFETALRIPKGAAAAYKLLVADEGVASPQLGAETSFRDSENLLAFNGFSPAISEELRSDPDVPTFLSRDCPKPVTLSPPATAFEPASLRPSLAPPAAAPNFAAPSDEDDDGPRLEAK